MLRRRHRRLGSPLRNFPSMFSSSISRQPYRANDWSFNKPLKKRSANELTFVLLRFNAFKFVSVANAAAPRFVIRSFCDKFKLVKLSRLASKEQPKSPIPPPHSSNDSNDSILAIWTHPASVMRPLNTSNDFNFVNRYNRVSPSSEISRLSKFNTSKSVNLEMCRNPLLVMLQ